MTLDDYADFLLAMDAVAEIFPIELSATRKDAYFAALADIPWGKVEEAFHAAIRCEKFFPVPATLRELAGYAVQKLPAAEAAWQRLRNVECRYNREALDDPMTRQVFEAMGGGYVLEWGFGNWDLTKEDQKRREFVSRYRELQHAEAIAGSPERKELWGARPQLLAEPEEVEPYDVRGH
jgi:hypothetical protein